jgi:hypothetical protein
MEQRGLTTFYDMICHASWQYATSLTHGAYPLEILLLGKAGAILGKYPAE